MAEPTERWYVYRLRSDTELLYVGYTRHIKRRMRQHRRLKPWWAEVTEVRSEEFATEDAARQREKELWAAERPRYNRYNPFLTSEEDKESRNRARREYRRSPEWQQRAHEYNRTPERQARDRTPERRTRSQTPEGRALNREAQRRCRMRKRWQQDGPGLF